MINLAEFCDTPLNMLPQSFSLSNLAGSEIQNVDIKDVGSIAFRLFSSFLIHRK
jgi:hypothetical protein